MSNAAYRYAYSLSSLCIEENIIDTIYDKFTSFYDSLLSNEELYNVLSNETIMKEDKKSIFNNILSDEDNKILKNFFNILVDKDRICEIKMIYLNFKKMYLEYKGILDVEVVSANPLSDELKESLKNKLSKKLDKTIILNEKIDKDIIGGIVLFINGKMIDLSVKNELNQIKRQLKETKIV